MLQFPRWKVDVTVGRDLVKTLYETATSSKAAIDKAKHKLRGAVSSAGAFKFKATKVDEDRAAKKSPRQLEREIAEALGSPSRRKVPGYSNYGGGGAFAPMGSPPPRATKSRTPPRRGHATKKSTRTGTSDKINIDQLAKLFDLPDWDRIDEMNQQHYWEMSRGADDEEAQLDAERAAQDEVYGQWYDAVESVASKLFDKHGLELQPTGKQGTETRRYEFKIVPSSSWNDAANKIRETINGVGDFHSNDLKEFLQTQAATARQAALSHLGYIRQYPAVYGGSGVRQLYDQAWR